MPKAVLHHRQNVLVLTDLGEEQGRRVQASLFKSWRIQVEPRQRPQHAAPGPRSRPCRDTDGEQRGSGVVGQRRGCRRHFVQPVQREAAVRQSRVEWVYIERQHIRFANSHVPDLVTQTRHYLG